MAGSVSLSPEERWSVAGWLFDWTVEFLAANVSRTSVRTSLKEIVDENLGWLALGDYGPDAERDMRALLRSGVVAAADGAFPADMPGRAHAIDLLEQLSRRA